MSRYQVTYHTYLASRRPSYTPSVEHVVGWKHVKHSLLVLQIFVISEYLMLTWEKIPGSPRFFVLQAMEIWAEQKPLISSKHFALVGGSW